MSDHTKENSSGQKSTLDNYYTLSYNIKSPMTLEKSEPSQDIGSSAMWGSPSHRISELNCTPNSTLGSRRSSYSTEK
jgi:hypothetical protein